MLPGRVGTRPHVVARRAERRVEADGNLLAGSLESRATWAQWAVVWTLLWLNCPESIGRH